MTLNIRKPTQSLCLDSLKWVLCFLMLMAVGLSIGCKRDEEDLSDKYLVIWRMYIDKQELDINQIPLLLPDTGLACRPLPWLYAVESVAEKSSGVSNSRGTS